MERLPMLTRMFYPNWLSVDFFTKGWPFFFSQEKYNISVLSALVLLVHWFTGHLSLHCIAAHLLLVVAFRRFLAGGICNSTKKLTDKTVIITGANVGIGKETARDLYSRGARVIMACRDLLKAEAARKDIVSSVSRAGGSLEVRKLDLSSLESVRKFAADIKKDGIIIHILVNNAGVMFCPHTETSEGFELQMGTNHFGHFLLTNLLLPQLRHSEPARIVNLSSIAHLRGEINFDDFNYKNGYSKFQAYANSKFANVIFTRHLAKILKGSNIQVFSVHPGSVYSDLSRHLVHKFINDYVVPLIVKTTMEGAQTTIYCALEATQHDEMYFSDCAVGWALKSSKDDKLAEKFWNFSAKLVGLEKGT